MMKKSKLILLIILCGMLLPCTFPVSAQQISLSGEVVDADNLPLPGVTILVEGATTGTTTDASGRFRLNVDGEKTTLLISFVGYESQRIAVENRRTFHIIMQEALTELEEVVVVAYGSQKKVSVTAAISTVQTKELKQSSAANLSSALAGRLPGLIALQSSGQPGNDAVSLYLRGRGTLNGFDPLIMIDGVPRSNISTLDPNEIASVSILKDASATAVFGVRGANGVILITTRRGTPGKAELSISTDYSLQQFITRADRIHSWEFAELRNEAARNGGAEEGDLPYTPYMIDLYKSGADRVFYPDRDVFHEYFLDWSPQTRVNVNLNGGTDQLTYFLNVGYIGQGGQFKTEPEETLGYDPSYKMNRYSFRSNVDYAVTKNFKMSLNLASYLEKMNSPQTEELFSNSMSEMVTNMIAYAWATPPTDPGPLTVEGYGYPGGQVLNQSGQARNTYGEINRRGYRQETNTMLNSSLALDWGLDFITKGLSAKAILAFDAKAVTVLQGIRAYDIYSWDVARTADEQSSYGLITGNQNLNLRLAKSRNTQYYLNLQASLNYARSFGKHEVGAMFLFQRDNWDEYWVALPYNMVGLVGRVTYGYDNRYLAEVNLGYNGSEQFAEANRFGFFPAFSAGWVISNESFLKDHPVLTNLKLRASYGKVGNDKLGGTRFIYMSDIYEGGGEIASLDYGKTIEQGKIGNETIQWEEAYKQNYGLDVQVFKCLSLTADFFRERRDHILITRQTVPNLQGVPLGYIPKVNMAQVDNYGYEFELSFRKTLNPDWTLSLTGNYAYNENKQIMVDEPIRSEDYAYRYRATGYSIGQPFGYEVDYSNGNGYINTPEELNGLIPYRMGGVPRLGDLKYVNRNNDEIIDPKDMVPMGYSEVPRISYGLSGMVNYKNLDFSFLFSGIAKSSRMYTGWGVTEFGLAGFFSDWHRHAWTQERYANGEQILYPALGMGEGSSQQANSFYLLDRSFLRLKTVEIGYALPQAWLQPTGIKRARFYMNGNNLFTWKKYPTNTVDPEQTSTLAYPVLKMINFGVNVTF
jgi:TonB-linked SusC/RagA family outer membrane protein